VQAGPSFPWSLKKALESLILRWVCGFADCHPALERAENGARGFMKRSSDVVAKIGIVFASTFSIEGFREDGQRRLSHRQRHKAPRVIPNGTTSPAPLCDAPDLLL
jgi:hypothetical protein